MQVMDIRHMRVRVARRVVAEAVLADGFPAGMTAPKVWTRFGKRQPFWARTQSSRFFAKKPNSRFQPSVASSRNLGIVVELTGHRKNRTFR
jgi:hypothetical protein